MNMHRIVLIALMAAAPTLNSMNPFNWDPDKEGPEYRKAMEADLHEKEQAEKNTAIARIITDAPASSSTQAQSSQPTILGVHNNTASRAPALQQPRAGWNVDQKQKKDRKQKDAENTQVTKRLLTSRDQD